MCDYDKSEFLKELKLKFNDKPDALIQEWNDFFFRHDKYLTRDTIHMFIQHDIDLKRLVYNNTIQNEYQFDAWKTLVKRYRMLEVQYYRVLKFIKEENESK